MKKAGLLIFSVLVAMATLGVGYAQWSRSLDIGGTVAVGNFGVEFAAPPIGPETTGWDSIELASWSTTGQGSQALNVEITYAYPGLVFVVPYTVMNTGDIPVTVTLDSAAMTPPTGGLASDITMDNTGGVTGVVPPGMYSAVTGNVKFTVTDNVVPGGTYTLSIRMTAHQATS